MNIWHDIDEERIYPTDFMAVVEISMGSNMKYELDKKTGMLSLDRVLFTATHYPMNYGFIPRTYADDHDPLDVLLLCSEPILPMTLVRSYPIGVMTMEDGGMGDEKIIAIPYGDPTYMSYTDVSELPKHIFEELMHFFSVYKQLERGKQTEVKDIGGPLAAVAVMEKAMENYRKKYGRGVRRNRNHETIYRKRRVRRCCNGKNFAVQKAGYGDPAHLCHRYRGGKSQSRDGKGCGIGTTPGDL